MTDLTLSGTTAGQPVTDMASLSPLSAVTVTGPAGVYTTVSLVLSSTANGALSHLGVGVLSADGSTYTVSGSTADVQTALRGLVFTPVAHEVAVGSAVTTGFTLTASDAAGAVTDARTSVVATAADTPPTITDTSAMQAPSNSSTLASQTFAPFRYVSLADPDSGAVETITITLAQNGAATDAVGLLSGAGLTKSGTGTYTLASAGPAAETAALQALGFTPASPGTAAALGVTFSVSDGAGPAVTASTTLGLVGNTGAKTVVTNSAEALTVYNDTASSQVTHTYATTIEAVLNGASVVYDQSFSLPYSDPQVQAAVAQAQAALQNAGASAGSPSQTASNLTTLSSLATAAETGRSTTPTAYQTTTAFGPGFVGPNVDVTAADNTEADRGFFYVQNGQTNININAATTTTVSRTVTTTSTDLLSQQYVITGTTMAAPASTTTLISSSAAGVEGNAASETIGTAVGFTADGASVLFGSTATNLALGDTNATSDLFLKNTATGAITLITTDAAGVRPNTGVTHGSVDGDGNLVAFDTTATNLDPRATDGSFHTYVRNVSAGALTLVAPTDYVFRNAVTGAVEASTLFFGLANVSISGDGRYVAVQAFAGNNPDVLLLDTLTHTGVDLSSGSGVFTGAPAISRDGSTVVFATTASLQPAGAQPADGDSVEDVYAYSIANNTFQLVSDTQGANAPSVKSNGYSQDPVVSSDGTHVAFATQATNLDSRDTDTNFDIYVKNLTTGQLTLADVTAGGVKANSDAYIPAISADGTEVAFESAATNLVAGVTDGNLHAYVKNLTTGALTLLDQTSTGAAGNGVGQNPILSPDGTHAAFFSTASNLVANDTNGAADVFLTTVPAAAVTPPTSPTPTPSGPFVSASAAGVEGDSASTTSTITGGITADGTSVLFSSTADNLSPGDTNTTSDLFLKATATGAITLISTNAAGVRPNADVFYGSVDGDGNLAAFTTTATNLDARAADGNSHLYVRNVASGTLTLIAPSDYPITNAQTGAVEAASNFTNLVAPSISGDGRYVAVQANNGGGTAEILVFDTVTHTAKDLNGLATIGSHAVFSEDGSTVVFHTTAQLQPAGTAPADTDNVRDVYAYTLATNSFQLVSDTAGANTPSVKGDGDSVFAAVSNNGSVVAFQSAADNLDPRDTDTGFDVYAKDLTTGRLYLVDVTADGSTKANAAATNAVVSGDGARVAFTSAATNLVPGVTDGHAHIYVKTLATGAIAVLDQTSAGALGDMSAAFAMFSPDSTHVAFTSSADNLVANDTNGASDVFLTAVPAPVAPPANTPPAITGVASPESDPGGATLKPFAGATVTDTNAATTFSVQLQSVAVVNGQPQNLGTGGAFSGGGFTVAGGVATFTGTSLAALQAAVRSVNFTPGAADARIVYTVGDSTGATTTASVDVVTPANTPPTLGGTQAGQADTAGVAISPFSQVTVTDPDANQAETVTVTLSAAANGTLSGGGFVQTAPGVYSVTAPAAGAGASAAAAQADLRAAVFTPTAGQSATTTLTVSVTDGTAVATSAGTSVAATYTAPVVGGGGGGGAGVTGTGGLQPATDPLLVEFQNLERALLAGVDAVTPGTAVNAAVQAFNLIDSQYVHGQLGLAQAEAALQHLVDGTTAVAVADYAFFTGFTPTAAGLNYLVHSVANATDLNDAYYARFSTENRYINFAVNLATGQGAGAAAFQAAYGPLSLTDSVAKAYAAVFGAAADATKVSAILNGLVPDGLGGQETRAAYFAQYGGDGPNGQGTKAAAIGFLLAQAVETGSGVYGAATEHYLAALAHGIAPAMGSELALTYGPAVSLVGLTPTADPTVTG